jgi:hypothetical protein
VFAVVWVLAILSRSANYYFILAVTSQLIDMPNAVRLSDHPQFSILALSVTLANVLEAVCFIPSTFIFLYHIASKLRLNGRELLISLFMEHQGVDYVLLVATKMYILVSGVLVLLTGGQDNTTHPVNYVIPWSHTLAIVTFMSSSFRTTQALLTSTEKRIGATDPMNLDTESQRKASATE